MVLTLVLLYNHGEPPAPGKGWPHFWHLLPFSHRETQNRIGQLRGREAKSLTLKMKMTCEGKEREKKRNLLGFKCLFCCVKWVLVVFNKAHHTYIYPIIAQYTANWTLIIYKPRSRVIKRVPPQKKGGGVEKGNGKKARGKRGKERKIKEQRKEG